MRACNDTRAKLWLALGRAQPPRWRGGPIVCPTTKAKPLGGRKTVIQPSANLRKVAEMRFPTKSATSSDCEAGDIPSTRVERRNVAHITSV